MGPDPRRLTALIETQSALAAAGPDAGAVMSIVTSHARELTGADGCVIELVDDSGKVFRAAADSAVVQVGRPLDQEGLAGRAVAERRLMTLVDIAQEGGAGPFRSGVAAPLQARDRVVGVLSVFARRPDAFTEDDRDTIRRLSQFAAHQVQYAIEFEELERTSRRDPLTGLGNRRALDETLETELARHARYGRSLSLVIVDLDGFKAVNDTLGHPAGDRLLVMVAQRLSEIRGADAAFRLGGDEFAVVLPETGQEEAQLVARRLARRIREDTFPNEVSASWGAAQAAGTDLERLLAEADAELYARKRSSTNSESAAG